MFIDIQVEYNFLTCKKVFQVGLEQPNPKKHEKIPNQVK